jgi:hypothetical protein
MVQSWWGIEYNQEGVCLIDSSKRNISIINKGADSIIEPAPIFYIKW